MKTRICNCTSKQGFAIALALCALLSLALPVRAATNYWEGVATAQNTYETWATAANWDVLADGTGGAPGVAPGASDTAVFNTTGNIGTRGARINANTSIGSLIFNNTGATTICSLDGITRRTLSIGAGGVTISPGAGAVNFGTGSRTTSLALLASQTWLNNSSALLTHVNGSDNANLQLSTYTLTIDGIGPTTFASRFMQGSAETAVIKNGTGLLTFSVTPGGATFSGDVQINGGTVRYGVTNALPSTADVIFNTASGTATLDLNNFTGTNATLTLGGAAGTVAAVTTGTGMLSLGGDVTYNAANNPNGATISGLLDLGAATRTFTVGDSTAAAYDLTVSAAISGSAAGLIKEGAGSLPLSGANTYNGTTAINSGTLQVNGSHTAAGDYTVSGGATLGGIGTINSAVTINTNGTLAPGTNTVAGSVLTCAGGLTLAAGVTNAFDCTASTCDSVAVTGALTIQGSATVALTLNGATLPKEVTIFTFTSVTGDEYLTSWTVTGLPSYYVPCVRRVNNSLVVMSNAGTVLRLF